MVEKLLEIKQQLSIQTNKLNRYRKRRETLSANCKSLQGAYSIYFSDIQSVAKPLRSPLQLKV
jgi:hypothetical protein